MWLRLALFSIALWHVKDSVAILVNMHDTFSLWPQPNSQMISDTIYIYNPDNFSITVSPRNRSSCPLISTTIGRFMDNMKTMENIVMKKRREDKNVVTAADLKEVDKKIENETAHTINDTNRFKRELSYSHTKPTIRPEDELDEITFKAIYENSTQKGPIIKNNTESDNRTKETHTAANLRGIVINLMTESCRDYPYYLMNESYRVAFHNGWIVLTSPEIWGIMRGLETISQLFFLSADKRDIAINVTFIVDKPNYPHRALLLDTARHYISVNTILKTLDAMAMNKMNVFHWVLVNDESFPFQSQTHPELSEAGAYHPQLVYTKADIQKVVEFARTLGIRVIPELDMPVHVSSIKASHPDVVVECVSGGAQLNPLVDETYELLTDLYLEILDLFPDDYLHFGGTDIYDQQSCWREDPIISQYIIDRNITFGILLTQFYQRMVTVIPPEKKIIIWEDVFYYGQFNSLMFRNLVVEINKHSELISPAIEQGQQVLWSMHYSLYSEYGEDEEFHHLYRRDPRFLAAQYIHCSILLRKFVIGAEVTVTTYKQDDANIHSHVWPRASAIAELLWTNTNQSWPNSMTYTRAAAQVCRMRRRAIPAAPLNPSFCITVDNVVRSNYDDFDDGPGRLL